MAAINSAVNANCPMTGDPVDSKIDTVDYNGQPVGFCCEECKPKWNALSDDEKQTKLVSAM